MNSKYKTRIKASNANIETEVRNVAKKIGHHGPDNLKEYIRQRMNVHMTDDWATELCKEFHQ